MTNGQKIWNRIKKEFPRSKKEPKLKVGFCPYLESMWDSMESVYTAAEADDSAEAFIIPIPYITKGDGRMHQQFLQHANNYPSKLSNLDIIVIHNPYDDSNRITELVWTSAELRSICKLLVYIPYFTTPNVADHFIMQKGVYNADLIFVDNANVRMQYINGIKKATGYDYSEKVIALGSPKFDAEPKSMEVPQAWRKRMDGKKVILYQTSIVPLMNNPTGKMAQISNHLQEWCQDDSICVIWRMHPLYEDTIKVMYPEILPMYYKLLNKFAMLSNTIVDDTTDMHRALALADVMISDGSSLDYLFKGELIHE